MASISFALQSLYWEEYSLTLPDVNQLVGAQSPDVQARLSETELRAWQALLHAHHDVTRRLDAELREEHGLSLGAYDVLLRLARAPGRALHMTELAKRVMLSPRTTMPALSWRVSRTEGARSFGRRPRHTSGASASISRAASARRNFGM